jgi:hypothetical protein
MENVNFDDVRFRKSSFSGNSGCVEVAIKGESVGIRDSKGPDGAVLVFDRREWRAFVAGVQAGEFNIE